MRASRPLAVLAGIASIGLATMLVAAPASAATLPDGQQITVVQIIQLDPDQQGPQGSRMWTASPVDAELTDEKPVQTPVDVQGIDVNDDGIGYATEAGLIDETTRVAYLWKADAKTGELTDPFTIVAADGLDVTLSECPGIDLQPDGTILLACDSRAINGDLLNSFIGVVTPTGVFTPYYDAQDQERLPDAFQAIAYDAVTDELWAFGESGNFVATLVDTSGEEWTLGEPITLRIRVVGADFDRGGQLWVTERSEGSRLYTLDLANPDTEPNFIGETFPGPDEAITVWGKVALPATGPEFVVPIGLGTALLFLAGAAFIATSRIQRRSE